MPTESKTISQAEIAYRAERGVVEVGLGDPFQHLSGFYHFFPN